MGKGGSAPEPSTEERELQRQQLAILQEQQATNKALEPYVLTSLGLTKGADGTYAKMSDEEKYALMSPEEKLSTDISKLQSERTQKALKGELPVAASLESSLATQKSDLEEYLSRKLGKNWRQSTPGITKLATAEAGAEQLREAQRYGEIDTGTGLMLAEQNAYNEGVKRQNAGYNFLGTNQLGLMNQYNSAAMPFQNQSSMNMQAQIIRNQNATNTYNAVGSAIGTVGGAYAYASKYGGSGRTPQQNNPGYRRQNAWAAYANS